MDFKITVLSILFEVLAVVSALGDFTGNILLFFILHGIASFLLSIVVWTLIPNKYKKPFLSTFAGIYLVLFMTPVLNYLALFVFVVILRKQKDLPLIPGETIPIFELVDEKIMLQKRRFGESSVREFVLNKEVPKNLRLNAFLLLTEIKTPSSISLLKIGLIDPDDEIRLLSFSVIEKLEKQINERIHKNLEKLKGEIDKKERGEICKNLAFLYWENVYLGIADKEIVEFYITEAEKYAKKAIKILGDNPYLILLLGKISLRRNRLDDAYTFLSYVLNENIPEFKVAPYLAELFYKNKEFDKVKEIINKYKYITYDPTFYPVALFWRGK